MTDSKITGLSARTSTQVATGDVFVFVDVSDTSMAASGTDRKMTAQEVARTAVSLSGGTPSLTLGTAGSAGTANTLVRTDATIAAFDATVPVTQAVGDAAAAGSATRAARRDHKHGMPAFAAPTVTFSSAASAGTAATLLHSDAVMAAFSTGTPATQAIGDSASKGTAAFAARLDHKHAMPAFASPTVTFSSAASAGSAATLLHSDAVLAVFSTHTPGNQAIGDSASKGTSNFAARTDHAHGMPSSTAIYALSQSLHTSTAALTLALTDAGKIVEMNKATTNSVTVPSSSSVAFATGTRIDIVQFGAGATTIVAGTTGVTIHHTTAKTLKLLAKYAGATLYKRAANEWVAVGNFST